MTRRSLVLGAAGLPASGQVKLIPLDDKTTAFTFESEEAEVRLIQEDQRPGMYMPAVRMKRKYKATDIIITVFFYAPADLLLSATSIVPYVGPNAMGAGDAIRLPAEPVMVRLKVLRLEAEFEIKGGRKWDQGR